MPATITLDDYEIANLRSALESFGHATWNKDWPGYVERSPLYVLNTGDWVGQIYNRLPPVEQKPNRTPQELAREANSFVPQREQQQTMNSDNKFLVCTDGDKIVIRSPSRLLRKMSREDAVNLAAWILAKSEVSLFELNAALSEIRGTPA